MQTKIQVVMFSFLLCEGWKQWTCILLVTCPKYENGEILITDVTLDYQLKEFKFTHNCCLVATQIKLSANHLANCNNAISNKRNIVIESSTFPSSRMVCFGLGK